MPKVSVERPEVLVKKLFHPYKRRSPPINHDAKARLLLLAMLDSENSDPDTISRFLEALSSLPPYPDLDSARQISTSFPGGDSRPESRTEDQEYNDKREQLIAPQQKPNVHRPIRSLIFALTTCIVVFLTWGMLGFLG
ncbi:hypothetical protein L218DRAFT_1023906 [Marasmius fiardii PR-910]|nr:hypothetical protein L218DRAFT_1023906 [Marasmius fiardii PR-910]